MIHGFTYNTWYSWFCSPSLRSWPKSNSMGKQKRLFQSRRHIGMSGTLPWESKFLYHLAVLSNRTWHQVWLLVFFFFFSCHTSSSTWSIPPTSLQLVTYVSSRSAQRNIFKLFNHLSSKCYAMIFKHHKCW